MLVVAIAALVAASIVLWASRPPRPPAYAALRQSRIEDVPGSFGLTMKPPPGGFDPAISPGQALQIASQGREAPGPVFLTLASVPGFFTGSSDDSPQWLIIVRNLCYPAEKGELVSSSRRPPQNQGSKCSMRNLWIQIVNPTSGDRTAVVSAYDPTAAWVPATGGV